MANDSPMRLIVERDVPVPMRDGARLAADIYRPDTDERLPVILVRLPYNKRLLTMQTYAVEALRAADGGYVAVYQDTRGRFASGGDFYPFLHEAADGYDSVEWCAAQSWSNGSVGMSGGSYFGATQWLAATQQPPHLRAIAPMVTSAGYDEGWTHRGGAFHLGFALSWALSALAPETALRLTRANAAPRDLLSRLLAGIDSIETLFRTLPLAEQPELLTAARYYADWLAQAPASDYWRRWRIDAQYERVLAPAFNVGGWYDLFLGGTIANYTGMRARGGSAQARNGQRLLIGPWAHGAFSGFYPDYRHGVLADLAFTDLSGRQLRWFDRWLKGVENGTDDDPPVRIFVMGENVWRDEQEWPLTRAEETPYFLHSNGCANTLSGDGGLSLDPPSLEPPDVYLYDPRNPAPTLGGATFLPGLSVAANAGPRDQRPVETRADVLVYSSAPLAQPLEVTGPVRLRLYAASSAVDTDWTAKLIDVHPDGYARLLCDGIIRARYRDGMDRPRPLTPGAAERYEIDLWATSNVFQAGHRLRVEISSSNFPRWDRNPNTGVAASGPEELIPALQTVLHDGDHPSCILLPIIPR